MTERYDAIVVGTGAGGGIIAAELAQAGRSVLALEAGPRLGARDFTRWEAPANHTIWFPVAFADAEDGGPPIPMFRGRVTGGTTAVNSKVALRIIAEDYRKWHDAAGITGDGGAPLSHADLAPHYERVERVDSYTDVNCSRCGSCLQGCPTNAGKNTFNVYLQDAIVDAGLTLEAQATVTRIVIEDRGDGLEATGVEWSGADGAISAHSLQRMRDADGGYIIEAATVQDPIGASVALAREDGTPLWGQELVDAMRGYRHLTGLLTLINDENNGRCFVDDKGRDRYSYRFSETERARGAASQKAAAEILRAAGATEVYATSVAAEQRRER